MIEKITKVSEDRLADCLDVFRDDTLDQAYQGQVLEWVITGVKKGEAWVAMTSKDEIVGFMWIEEQGFFHAFPYLALIGVKKGYQGCGVGHLMLSAYEAMALALGYNKITLMVGDFNTEAKKLYESFGFKEIGLAPKMYMPTISEFIMVKELPNVKKMV